MSKHKQQRSRMKRRPKKYNFRQKMEEDYYGTEAVRTKYEFLVQGFLQEANLPYLINQVFCFECDKFFPYEHRDIPHQCYYCNVSFIKAVDGEKGRLSRPDFVITDSNNKIKGIIRVDGRVHDVKKATRISDYFILQAFNERKIKVFIIRNELLLEKNVKEIRELVQDIKLMIEDEDKYTEYTKSKYYEEVTYCPDIQVKRYNRK